MRTFDPRKWDGPEWPTWVVTLFFNPLIRVREALGRYLGEEDHINSLRRALALSGRHAEGAPLCLAVMEANPRATPTDDIEYFNASVEYGISAIRLGWPEVARLTLLTAGRGFSNVLGPLDRQTLNAWSWLAVTLTREQRFDEALRIRRRVLDGYCRTLGPRSPTSQEAMFRLANLLRLGGEDDEAGVLARCLLDWMARTGRTDEGKTKRVKQLISAIDRDAKGLTAGTAAARAVRMSNQTGPTIQWRT